ncbi:MAG TPA: hypothetical protein VIV27_04245, partial [Halioglobus sp.]
WHPVSRLHFAMGVMSYLSSPLWLMFLLLTGLEAYNQIRAVPDYFFRNHLGPVWPVSFTVEMKVVLIFTLAMLFLPKLMALILIVLDGERRRAFGGIFRATVSALLESVFSILVAPVLMLFQTKFVWAILLRRTIGWPAQQRADHSTGFREAASMHGVQTLLAIAAGVISYIYIPDYFGWFVPVLSGVVLSIPVSMLSSSVHLGHITRRLRLFMTPEELQRPEVLVEFDKAMAVVPSNPMNAHNALREPHAHALHLALLPTEEVLSRRQMHYAQSLLYKTMEEGLPSLSTVERRELFSRANTLRELHDWAWGTSAE